MNHSTQISPVRQAIEIAITLSLIFVILAWCLQIARPFISLLIWSAVIAISIYGPFLSLRARLGGRNTPAAVLITLIGLAVVIVPTWMFAGSMIESAQSINQNLTAGTVNISPPSENVKDWPLIGNKAYDTWSEVSANLQSWLVQHNEQVHSVVKGALTQIANIGLSLLQLIVATAIAGVFLANADATRAAMLRFCTRIMADRGEEMLQTTTATIRSVAVGVLGIAFIQAMLGGAGMLLVGVPGAGIWTLAILILAIAQLPPWIILGPVIFYVFSIESTTVAVIFMIWSIIVSFSDVVLKPLLLGRGVDTPILIILIGAIGGMITSGIIGLFVGAVVFTLGYKLVQAWLNAGEQDAAATPQTATD